MAASTSHNKCTAEGNDGAVCAAAATAPSLGVADPSSSSLYPTAFMCHGGGPMPLLGDPGHDSLVASWRVLMDGIVARHGAPRAIVVVSAHYETAMASIGGAAHPQMLYDYGGFPEAAYRFKYAAPGDPALALRMKELLQAAGVPAEVDAQRPFDHGVFVPLGLMFPNADIPVVPLSVLRTQDPAAHIAMGRALAPLRRDGVLFVGSGSSMHNFQYLMSRAKPNTYGHTFNDALTAVLCDASLRPAERMRRMEGVTSFPGIAESHPPRGLEHLMPLLTCVGLGNGGVAVEASSTPFGSANVRQYIFYN